MNGISRWIFLISVCGVAQMGHGELLEGSVSGAGAELFVTPADRAVGLAWASLPGARYEIYRRNSASTEWKVISSQPLELSHYVDFEVENQKRYEYQVRMSGAALQPVTRIGAAIPNAFENTDDFLDALQRSAVAYFWFEANPTNGLIRDRSRPDSYCSIAAVGFGLTAIGIGIDRSWIPREAGADRVLRTLRTFWESRQGDEELGNIGYRGWFYHFLEMETGARGWRSELSTIDTALLLAGVLYVRQYFDEETEQEREIRDLAERLIQRVDWRWMLDEENYILHGWKPESGFLKHRWVGYNEAMLLYLLAMGSDAEIPSAAWGAWQSGYKWASLYGQSYVVFPPLFGHQYSHCWIDFRGIADSYMRSRGLTYFENSRRATLAQHAYCIENPGGFRGYGPKVWGLSACDGPGRDGKLGYAARGAPPPENDDGTIAPTAAGGSIVFTPELSIECLRHLYQAYRERIWTAYGFRDAFNLDVDWWDPDVLGIDQGAILLMVENHRTGGVWKKFMENPQIQRGLERAGFKPVAEREP